MAKPKAPDYAKLAEQFRTKSIPSARALTLYQGVWSRDNYGTLSVLVDAKLNKVKGDEMRALQAQLNDHHWEQLRRRTQGIWYPDDFAERLRLPSFDRIEEVNDQYIHESARQAANEAQDLELDEDDGDPRDLYDTDAYRNAEEAVRNGLYQEWATAVVSATDTALARSQLDPNLSTVGDPRTGRLTIGGDGVDWGAAAKRGEADEEWSEHTDKASAKEYVLWCLDEHFVGFNEHDIRRVYEQAF